MTPAEKITPAEVRELAAKLAEQWVFDPAWGWTASEIRQRQSDVAQEIATAIRRLPVE